MNTAAPPTKSKGLAWLLLLILISALAFDLRFNAILQTEVISPIRADASSYFLYAYNLSHHGIYSRSPASYLNQQAQQPATSAAIEPQADAVRPPGFPFFAALVMQGSHDKVAIRKVIFWQTLLGLSIFVAVFFMTDKLLTIGARCLLLTLVAISPHLINMNLYFLTESLFCTLLLLYLWTHCTAVQKNCLRLTCLAGTLLALACLVRSTLQYFFLFVVLFYVLQARAGRAKTVQIIAFLLPFFLITGAWSARNLVSTGQSSDPLLRIATLQHGMYPDFKYQGRDETKGIAYRFDPNSEAISADTPSVLREIKRRFSEQPKVHLQWYLFGKMRYLWSWDVISTMGHSYIYPVLTSPYFEQFRFKLSHRIAELTHNPLMLLSLLAAIVCWLPGVRRCVSASALDTVRLIGLVVIYYCALHTLAAPYPRYAIPIRPLNYLLAVWLLALALKIALDVARAHRSKPLGPRITAVDK